MKKTVKIIHSPKNKYYIKHEWLFDFERFWVEIKTRNWFKLLRQYYSDHIGNTCLHPIFLNNRYYNTIENAEQAIKNHITK